MCIRDSYNHETIALAFAITEEAVEDNLYDKLAGRYTKALARSMNNAKQIKGANVLNNGFSSSYTGGDGKELLATDHPTVTGGDFKNELTTAAAANLRIIGKSTDPENSDATAANCNWYVRFNAHLHYDNVAGI